MTTNIEEMDDDEFRSHYLGIKLRIPPTLSRLPVFHTQMAGTFFISPDPEIAMGFMHRVSNLCPICEVETKGDDRIAATLEIHWGPDGKWKLGVGVWVHPACFEQCIITDRDAAIPW